MNEDAIAKGKAFDKDDLVYTLMIRQPDFVDKAYGEAMIEAVKVKKGLDLIGQVAFEILEEGACVQVLHLGAFEEEDRSFDKMEAYCKAQGLKRKHKGHKEVYLSDFRKVDKDQLKTVLRIQV